MEEIKKTTAEAKKHFSKLGLMFFLGTLIIYAAQSGVLLAAMAIKPEWLENVNISLLLSILPLYIIGMPLLILLVVKQVPGKAPEKHSMKPGQFLVALVMAFAIMYASNMLGAILTTIIGILKGSAVNNVIADIATSSNLFLNFGFMVICAPIAEEFIFRKLIVDRTIRYGQGVAIVLSGLMFGLFHGNLTQFAYAFTLGMFFAFIYAKTGKIGYTIVLHMIVNFVGSILSVLVVKGINLEEYMEVAATGNMEEIIAVIMSSLSGWVFYFLFAIFVYGMMIAGIVLLIVFRKKFKLEKGAETIEKGSRFKTVMLNVGMGLYFLFWIVIIVLQLAGVV